MSIWERITTKKGYRVLAVIALVIGAYSLTHSDRSQTSISLWKSGISLQVLEDQRQACIMDYFLKMGSPVPADMTNAVMATKRPELMAAIAKRESRGNPKAVGDHGKSKGAFQVQERYHGKVHPTDPMRQALQSQRLLDDLLRDNTALPVAVRKYNGAGPKARKYAKNVTRETLELAMGVN